MIEKHRKTILLLILILGFSLRFYGAMTVPLNTDERGDFVAVKEISLDPRNLKIPLVDIYSEDAGLMFHRYFIKIGWYILGETDLGARILFVIIGTVTIFIVYLLVQFAIGTGLALLTAAFIAIDQCHIGITRVADAEAIHLFFVVSSLFLFYRFVVSKNKITLLLNGLILGIGFWAKETIFILMPIYVLFLWFSPEHKKLIKEKVLWVSFLLSILIALLSVYLINTTPGSPRFDYIVSTTRFGISLNAISLYLGELFLILIRPFPRFFEYILVTMNYEIPFENFIFGPLTLIAILMSLRIKSAFIRLMTICFLFNIAVFSFIRNFDKINNIWAMSSFTWGILGLIPGVIVTVNLLAGQARKHAIGRILVVGLFIFLLVRSWDIVSYPIACYFPAKDYCIENIRCWLDSIGFLDKNRIININDERFLRSVYVANRRNWDYRKSAALRLAVILKEKGRVEEAKEYVKEVLSREPENKESLELFSGLRINQNGDIR